MTIPAGPANTQPGEDQAPGHSQALAGRSQPPPRPTIGITMGDPAGVGAEIIVKSLADPALRRRANFLVFGFSDQLAYTADMLELDWRPMREPHELIRRAVGQELAAHKSQRTAREQARLSREDVS